MDVEGVDSFTAAAIPELPHGTDAVVSVCDSVDVVVLGLVVQTAVEGCRTGPRAVDDVVLESVATASGITVEGTVTAVVRPTVPGNIELSFSLLSTNQIGPDEIVVKPDVIVTQLGMSVTVFSLGASLDPSVVIGDSSSVIVDIVVLNIYNKVVSVP